MERIRLITTHMWRLVQTALCAEDQWHSPERTVSILETFNTVNEGQVTEV